MFDFFHYDNKNLTCPLGHSCHECMLYVRVSGENPHTGEPLDGYECAFVVNAIMAGDNGRSIRQLHAAVAQQTNETVKRQDEFLELVSTAGAGPRRINHAHGQNQ